MTQDEAHRALTDFIARSAHDGLRCVLVITGKGLRKLGGDGRAASRRSRHPAQRRAALAQRAADPRPHPRLRRGAAARRRQRRALRPAAARGDDARSASGCARCAPSAASRSRRWRRSSAFPPPISRRSSMAGAAGRPMRWSSRSAPSSTSSGTTPTSWSGSPASRIRAITVDTAGLSPAATELANLLAERIRKLPPVTVEHMLELLKKEPASPRRRRRKAPADE